MEYPRLYGPWGNEAPKLATMESLYHAYKELLNMDDQFKSCHHFSVDLNDNDALKSYGDLTVEYKFLDMYSEEYTSAENEIKVKVQNWGEVRKLYELFLNSKVDKVKEVLKDIIKNG